MACEYIANQLQQIALNNPAIFSDSIPCRRGLIYHEDGTGNFDLARRNNGRRRSCNCGCCSNTSDYKVDFNGNIAIPEGGTVGPIAMGIFVDGALVEGTRAIYTPTAVDAYQNVSCTKIVKVPCTCGCKDIYVGYVNGSVNDPTFTPTPIINLVNANLQITPVND